jgi:hypothetical protein
MNAAKSGSRAVFTNIRVALKTSHSFTWEHQPRSQNPGLKRETWATRLLALRP